MPIANPTKREEMKRLILAGTDLDTIAAQLGYASGMSAYVVAHRWGLHSLREAAYSNPNRKSLAATADMLREPIKLLADK